MYEIGKQRLDGKYNVWRNESIGLHSWYWQIVDVCSNLDEAKRFISRKHAIKARREKKK